VSQAETLIDPAADPAERKKGIGGSDAAVIAGLSPWKSPLDLYLEKKGLWQDEAAGEAAYFGTLLEPVIAEEYARRTGAELATQDEVLGRSTLVHPEHRWMRGHVDRLVMDRGRIVKGLEVKTSDLRLSDRWGSEGSDEIPDYYIIQVQHYMALLPEINQFDVALLLGGNRFRVYTVNRNQSLIDRLIELEAEFWERVQTGNAPDPEPGERGKESLARLYPRGSQGKELEATPTLLNLARGLHQYRTALKELEENKTTLENEIRAIMADAERLNLGPRSYIGWKNAKDSKKVNWEAAARELGATDTLVQQHTTIVPGARRFLCQGLDKLFA